MVGVGGAGVAVALFVGVVDAVGDGAVVPASDSARWLPAATSETGPAVSVCATGVDAVSAVTCGRSGAQLTKRISAMSVKGSNLGIA